MVFNVINPCMLKPDSLCAILKGVEGMLRTGYLRFKFDSKSLQHLIILFN